MTAMEMVMRQSLDAMKSNLQSFVGITTLDMDVFYIRVDSLKHKRNVQRYLDLFCNGDKDIEEHDMRKLKTTTYLLHMNDIPHIGNDFDKNVWEYDLGVHFDSEQKEEVTLYFEAIIDQEMKNIETRQCEYCSKIDEKHKLLKCGACKLVYFCNEQCQKTWWPCHKYACKTKYRTKSDLLNSKQALAWKLILCGHVKNIFEFFDHVETKCGKKSRILLLTNGISNSDGKFYFQFRTVSMRFFTSYKKTSMNGEKIKKNDFLMWNQLLKSRPDAYMLAIPYNGYFMFFPMI
jgi:hypothetical protein|tara:strand:- start:3594 stop:4463 length:870 start_codon:yes stop_codon:yes gene_type:complete